MSADQHDAGDRQPPGDRQVVDVGGHKQTHPKRTTASAATTATLSPNALPISRIAECEWQQITVGGETGAVAAVFVVDVLDDPLRGVDARNRPRCRAARYAQR
jgi:hypothetical protein